jgi:hypothetical protein
MSIYNALIRSHRQNISRYRRLLDAELTEAERESLVRCLAAERSELIALLGREWSDLARGGGRSHQAHGA